MQIMFPSLNVMIELFKMIHWLKILSKPDELPSVVQAHLLAFQAPGFQNLIISWVTRSMKGLLSRLLEKEALRLQKRSIETTVSYTQVFG